MSAHQIHRMLGVTYKTAWFMCHRIREAMKDDGSPLGGPGKIVEADEAFIGGAPANKEPSRTVAPKKVVVSLGRARRRGSQLPHRECQRAGRSAARS